MSTPLTDFLEHILADWIKRSVESEINEKIDDHFFNQCYAEGIERWDELYTVEGACSFYQEVSEEIKADWFGRDSMVAMERAKSGFECMDDNERYEFLQWANKFGVSNE